MNAALVSVIYGQAIQPPAIAPKPFEVRPNPSYCSLTFCRPPYKRFFEGHAD